MTPVVSPVSVCGHCSVQLQSTDSVVTCSGICRAIFHIPCVKLSPAQCNAIKQCSNIKFFCDGCLSILEFCMNIQSEINDFKDTVNKKLDEFQKVFTNNNDRVKQGNKTYAEATEEVVVIKPKLNQESNTTKNEIRKQLKPSTLEVGITGMKNVRQGGVVIKCKNKEDVEKIREAAEKKMKKKYDVTVPKLRNPSIKIIDIEEDMKEDEIKKCIIKQNSCLQHDDSYINIQAFKKMKTKFMAIVEVDPLSFQEIMKNEKICIGWSMCRVFEYVRVYRCFKCGGFDHKADDCETGSRCHRCSDVSHKTDNCPSDIVVCANCVQANVNFKLNLKTDHSIFDLSCVCLQGKMAAEKKKN